MPERININNIISTLRFLGFLFFVVIVDLSVIISTMHIEASGAKLALPSVKFPKEIEALLTFLGIPSGYISPGMVFGFATTMLMFIGTFYIIYSLIGVIGTTQRLILNRNQTEVISLLQPLIITTVIALLLYGGLFNLWMIPVTQMQMAKYFWPMDFQKVLQGDAIKVIQQTTPDFNIILKRHEGEFYRKIVIIFPFVLLIFHIIASLLTEVFFLHVMTNLSKIEDRIEEVIGRGRSRLSGLSQSIRRFGNRQQESTLMEASRQAGLTPTPVIEGTPPREKGNMNSENYATPATETLDQGIEAEPLSLTDQPVRVIGGGDTITPNIARPYPDLYVVEERRDPETGEILYLIYTREFYEKMNNHMEVLR